MDYLDKPTIAPSQSPSPNNTWHHFCCLTTGVQSSTLPPNTSGLRHGSAPAAATGAGSMPRSLSMAARAARGPTRCSAEGRVTESISRSVLACGTTGLPCFAPGMPSAARQLRRTDLAAGRLGAAGYDDVAVIPIVADLRIADHGDLRHCPARGPRRTAAWSAPSRNVLEQRLPPGWPVAIEFRSGAVQGRKS